MEAKNLPHGRTLTTTTKAKYQHTFLVPILLKDEDPSWIKEEGHANESMLSHSIVKLQLLLQYLSFSLKTNHCSTTSFAQIGSNVFSTEHL